MKFQSIVLAFLTVALFAACSQAHARWYRPPARFAVGVGTAAYLGGYGGYGGYSPVEGYQRGMADVIRSKGQAAQDYAKARISYEDARTKYLDNKLKWTKIYWQRKNYADAQLRERYEKDSAARQKWLASRRGRKPETLPPDQLDAQTGAVEWPDALQKPIYADYRRKIEAALKEQANGKSNESEVRTLARQMQGELKKHIKGMNANEYIASRKFLDRMVNQMALAQGY